VFVTQHPAVLARGAVAVPATSQAKRRKLEKMKSIQIVGGMNDLVTGIVEFLPQG
jgi:predicted secreted Zn-dependent protease